MNPTPRQSPLTNCLLHATGMAVLAMNRFRYALLGYRTPRSFSVREHRRAIEYDREVVSNWRHFLSQYLRTPSPFRGRGILELGPGDDLGAGLLLLLEGARSYQAIDVNHLVRRASAEFYDALLDSMEAIEGAGPDQLELLQSELDRLREGRPGRLSYIWTPEFNLSLVDRGSIDLVVSQAAFEHFDDPGETIAQLSQIVRPGTVLAAEVDLKTHSRWIRDLDPLNIYRYSEGTYGLLSFSGIPNRVRPLEYEELLRSHGWGDIRIIPRTVLSPDRVSHVLGSLERRFQDEKNLMHLLSFVLLATKE